jgi:hypothetical protein
MDRRRGQAGGGCRNVGSGVNDPRAGCSDLQARVCAFARFVQRQAGGIGGRPDARGRELERKGLAGLLVLPPRRRLRLRLDLLRKTRVN